MTDYVLRLSDEELTRYRRMAEVARREEADLWALAGILPGADVVDVGCGPAAVTAQLADTVGPTGSVTGVDRDADALAAGQALLEAAGHTGVELLQGDADATGRPEASYDVAMLRHVLAHGLAQQQAIVDHLARLVRPGGCVYLVDVDLTGTRTMPAVAIIDEMRDRYAVFQHDRGGDPLAGLRLAELLRAAGLEVLVHRGRYVVQPLPPGARGPAWAAREAMVASGHVTPADLLRWEAALVELDAQEVRPTTFLPGFVAVGRRPAG